MGLVYCILVFVATLTQARRSLGRGVATLLCVGFGYGIFRARYYDAFVHFLFDAAVAGLYAGHFLRKPTLRETRVSSEASFWLRLMVLMPILLFLAPLQDPFVQLVGLRAAVFFLPLVIIGTRLEPADLRTVSFAIACLILIAFAFAIGEYTLGVPYFYPRNQMTALIYRSTDIMVRDGLTMKRAFRIPATFSNAHSYGGTMVASIPLLVDFLQRRETDVVRRWIVLGACMAAVLGVFLCGARSPVITLAGIGTVILFLNLRWQVRIGIVVVAVIAFSIVQSDDRLQRFKRLGNADEVEERVRTSVHAGFFEMVSEYPMGAGLARAVGTSIPFFLADIALPQIGMENEYGRIAVELGLPGLFIWVCFLATTLLRRRDPSVSATTTVGRRLVRVYCCLIWLTGLIGCGLLTSIPQTSLVLMQLGILLRASPDFRPQVSIQTEPGSKMRSERQKPITSDGSQPA